MNLRNSFFRLIPLLGVLPLAPHATAQQPPVDCQAFAKQLLQKSPSNPGVVAEFWNHLSCFVEATAANTPDRLLPMRTGLWKAVNDYGGSQQQGASSSSGASTNAVSKPSGPTALAEEFGGANVTTGTSSTTLQWSPGSLLQNLVLTGASSLCAVDDTPGCIKETTIENLSGLTFKITGNTSGNSSSPTGTASSTSTGSSSTVQPVKVSSQGASGPSFSGLTIQYSFLNSKKKAAVAVAAAQAKQSADKAKAAGSPIDNSSLTAAANSQTVQYHTNELNALVAAAGSAVPCKVAVSWANSLKNAGSLEDQIKSLQVDLDKASPASTEPSAAQVDQIANQIGAAYADLYNKVKDKTSGCPDLANALSSLYASVLEAIASDDLSTAQKGDLGLEYDLNTPQNKPSYSTVKLNYSHSWGKTTNVSNPTPAKCQAGDASSTNAANACAGKTRAVTTMAMSATQARFHSIAMAAAPTKANTAGRAASTDPSASMALQKATTTPSPWTFTASGVVDIYNAEPPSGIPNASHLRDIQAGAEISYLFAPTAKVTIQNGVPITTVPGGLRQFIGNITAAAAYSYQDQTTPAILTGPALSGFTGLPSSTTAAYAQRGVIHLGQVRLGFGSGSSISFPVAFTYSNRTELIVHPTWVAQFGVSYNLNSLFGGSGANSASTPSQ